MVFPFFLVDDTLRSRTLREHEAFEALYNLYHAPVLRYLHQLSGSADLAEELAQETFVKAYTGLLSFRGDCSAATWLFRIARNTYLNSRRRPSSAPIDTAEFLDIPDTRGYGDPVKRYAAGEQRGLIEQALARLPEQQRSILLLRDAEGLAYIEIADVLGLSLAAVRIKLFRARNAFRTIYCELENGEGDSNAEL
jgi:RNA polymerase sigma-70 factor (ECF subfamily)